MKAWVELDDAGRQFLVRQGTGSVTAVAAVDAEGSAYRVEIACEVPPGWSRAIRYTVQARVPASHPLLPLAMSAEDDAERVAWTVTWHRHEDVPADLPITSLDLATDTVSRLVALDRIDSTVPSTITSSSTTSSSTTSSSTTSSSTTSSISAEDESL